MADKNIDLGKLIEKLSQVNIDSWTFFIGADRRYYNTKLANEFDVDLIFNYKSNISDVTDKDYNLSISPISRSHFIAFKGKDVRELYNLIEDKYNKKPKRTKEENKDIFINKLNNFLEKQ